ncbi:MULTISPECIES: glycosyltransferase [Clostridium]|uniref:glycosyltransferase family protein n=1 Tax=Clostridium TaxID=1485 RepID=UPI00082680DE|nr:MULTISPECIES: glycosyltransferase [Clostridium]
MKDIVIFKGTGAYDMMQYFADKLDLAFKEEGFESGIIDLNSLDKMQFADEIKQKKPKLCIGFNSMSFNYNNIAYYRYFDLKHLSIMVDHPIYHIPTIDLNYDNLYILCNDVGRVNYLRNEIKIKNAYSMLLGADKNIECSSDKRDKDIVFFGTMIDYEELRKSWKVKFGKPINKLLNDAIEVGMYNSFLPVHEALNISMSYNGYDKISENDKMKFQLVLLPEIDGYLRFFNRHKYIEKIKTHKIHIYGNDVWTKFLNRDNVILHSPVGINDSIEILKRSKISLNATMTLVYNGITERVLNSAMCGSVVLSNYTPLLHEIFKENALLVDIKDMNNIDERLDDLINNDSKRNLMAEKARNEVEMNHTWNNRVREIANLI